MSSSYTIPLPCTVLVRCFGCSCYKLLPPVKMSWLTGQQLAAYNGAHMAALSDKYEEVYIRNLFADQQQVLWTAGCECSK